jgi:hypothetical protein
MDKPIKVMFNKFHLRVKYIININTINLVKKIWNFNKIFKLYTDTIAKEKIFKNNTNINYM